MDVKLTKKAAFQVMKRAYVPYSNCHVGAAICLKDGTIIVGSNVENASYGLTNCAERSAIFSLISQGYKTKNIDHMVIVSDFDGNTRPCGACRQVLSELLPAKCPIHMLNKDSSFTTQTINELLPESFTKEDLK